MGSSSGRTYGSSASSVCNIPLPTFSISQQNTELQIHSESHTQTILGKSKGTRTAEWYAAGWLCIFVVCLSSNLDSGAHKACKILDCSQDIDASAAVWQCQTPLPHFLCKHWERGWQWPVTRHRHITGMWSKIWQSRMINAHTYIRHWHTSSANDIHTSRSV